jgi:hypothetical protein
MSIIKVKTGGITADAITDALIADDVVGTEHLTANEVDTTALGADAVTAAQIADDAISEEHLDVTAITGHTAETSIADGDTLLIHDASASALRKMTKANFVSGVGGTNTPAFEAYLSSNTSQLSDDTDTKITFDGEIYDSDNTFSSGRFTPAVAGKYLIYGRLMFDDTNVADNTDEHMIKIFKNGAQESVFFIYPNTNDSIITYAEVIVLDDNDYIEIYAKMNNSNGGRVVKGADASQKSSTFGAFKIIGA